MTFFCPEMAKMKIDHARIARRGSGMDLSGFDSKKTIASDTAERLKGRHQVTFRGD